MDFLLKPESLVLEVKRSRESMSAKDLGSQLIEDIARYSAHPGCQHLVCFCYDPEGGFQNPRGLERDLSRAGSPFPVTVLIRPT
jgi:hypothetical protein